MEVMSGSVQRNEIRKAKLNRLQSVHIQTHVLCKCFLLSTATARYTAGISRYQPVIGDKGQKTSPAPKQFNDLAPSMFGSDLMCAHLLPAQLVETPVLGWGC